MTLTPNMQLSASDTGSEPGREFNMRHLLLMLLLVANGIAAVGQLSPKAGTISEGLYTNLYFGMNYKLPAGWITSFVATEGTCERECPLLDLHSSDPRSRRAITLTAELLASGGGERVIQAAASLEQMGAKKLAASRELSITSRKAYRVDYKSSLASGDVYYTIVMLTTPGKDYAPVFSFSSDSRKQLDALVDELTKAISFVGQS